MGCPCCGYGDDPEYIDARTEDEKRRDFEALPDFTKTLIRQTVQRFKESLEIVRRINAASADDLRFGGALVGDAVRANRG